jgi:predicted dehydrogenase
MPTKSFNVVLVNYFEIFPDTTMDGSMHRRSFLTKTAAVTTAAGLLSARSASATPANDTVVVGVMGVSRGRSLARTFGKLKNVEVKYLCDVDRGRLDAAATSVEKETGTRPQTETDFRKMLDDKDLDALICAAPNHWHAPAGILACSAGKHAYIEKPCSHNPWEGEMLVEAARKHKRCVQMGSQRRSSGQIQNGIKLVHEGAIGKVFYSRSWYSNLRGPIGIGEQASPPDRLDYDLWQGPAPRLPYLSNRIHYNWHWFWHYGNGEVGNNGVHSLDLARWGMDVEFPTQVSSGGGRYVYDDDQETADTHVVTFQFDGKKQIVWEGLSCNKHGINKSGFGTTFHGDKGTLQLLSDGYLLFDRNGKQLEEKKDSRGDVEHAQNFVDAIRANDHTGLNAEIEIGHRSTLLCHLGNMAHRTGRTLKCDPSNGHVLHDEDAMKLWKREYEPGWEPQV